MNQSRWEIVVMSDAPDQIITNNIRRATQHLAETFGYNDGSVFDIAAFAPNGECISEFAFNNEEEPSEAG